MTFFLNILHMEDEANNELKRTIYYEIIEINY